MEFEFPEDGVTYLLTYLLPLFRNPKYDTRGWGAAGSKNWAGQQATSPRQAAEGQEEVRCIMQVGVSPPIGVEFNCGGNCEL